MSEINLTGAEHTIRALPNHGIYFTFVVKDSAGSVIDITDSKITFAVIDGKGNNDSSPAISNFAATITDAPNGAGNVHVPPSEFNNDWGEYMSWSIGITYSGDSHINSFGSGELVLKEAL